MPKMLTISVVNGDEITKRVRVGIDGLEDLSPLFDRIIPVWFESRKQMFASQGFGKWPAYTAGERKVYVPYKARKHGRQIGTMDLLRWEVGTNALRLYRSMTNIRETRGGEAIARIVRDSLILGTSVPYAASLRLGGTAPERLGGHTYPARDVLELGNLQADIEDATIEYAREIARSMQGGRRTAEVRRLPIAGMVR